MQGPCSTPDGALAVLTALVGSKAKIATGSYTGTGTHGRGNPNSLTFDFEPKLVIIREDTPSGAPPTVFLYGCSYTGANSSYGYHNSVTWNGTSVSWYSNDGVGYQCNTNGRQHRYLAIG